MNGIATRRCRFHIAVVCVCTISLSACGFQLRGDAGIDPALGPMAVEGVHPGSPLLPVVRSALSDAGIEVARPGARAATRLRIVEDESGERIVSVTPQGRPREAELFYRVEFELHDASGGLLVRDTLVMTRDYAVDELDVLGRSHEVGSLRRSLRHGIVSALMRRLGSL